MGMKGSLGDPWVSVACSCETASDLQDFLGRGLGMGTISNISACITLSAAKITYQGHTGSKPNVPVKFLCTGLSWHSYSLHVQAAQIVRSPWKLAAWIFHRHKPTAFEQVGHGT